MKRIIIFSLFSFVISSYLFAALPRIETKNGNCNQNDPKLWYQEKTRIDEDGDGIWDHIHIVWCNGQETNTKYTEKHWEKIFLNNPNLIREDVFDYNHQMFLTRIKEGPFVVFEEVSDTVTIGYSPINSAYDIRDVLTNNLFPLQSRIYYTISPKKNLYMTYYTSEENIHNNLEITILDSNDKIVFSTTLTPDKLNWDYHIINNITVDLTKEYRIRTIRGSEEHIFPIIID